MKTKPSPAYTGNTKRRVRCQSGIMGERSRLQSRYGSLGEFVAYHITHGVAKRLGYCSAVTVWRDNPVIESSINPFDLRIVFP